MHHHESTVRRSALSFGLLLVVALTEVWGIEASGSLILLAHISEIIADMFAYLATLLAAVYSSFRDKRGRVHVHGHPEEVLAAVVNFTTMGIGILFALYRILTSFGTSEPVSAGWALVGPILATGVYLTIVLVVQNQDKNPSIVALRGHVMGDVLASAVAVGVTTIVLLLGTSIANPIGGMVVIGVLTIILLWQLWKFQKNRELPVLT